MCSPIEKLPSYKEPLPCIPCYPVQGPRCLPCGIDPVTLRRPLIVGDSTFDYRPTSWPGMLLNNQDKKVRYQLINYQRPMKGCCVPMTCQPSPCPPCGPMICPKDPPIQRCYSLQPVINIYSCNTHIMARRSSSTSALPNSDSSSKDPASPAKSTASPTQPSQSSSQLIFLTDFKTAHSLLNPCPPPSTTSRTSFNRNPAGTRLETINETSHQSRPPPQPVN